MQGEVFPRPPRPQVEIPRDSESYAEWLKKFDAPKTTDDCFTPPLVYDAVLRWTVAEFNLKESRVVRPFYPGGDYTQEDYSGDCVVVDNPPFSNLTKIAQWYQRRGILYLLFAPSLTAFSTAKDCVIITNSEVVYANGARVKTAFRTNMDTAVARSAPELSKAIQEANVATQKDKVAPLPKYEYPAEAITAAYLQKLAAVPYRIERHEAHGKINALDHQKQHGKSMFGGGYLVSRLKAAELKAAELKAAELKAAELKAAELKTEWRLSERERFIIKTLGDKTK